MLAKNVTFSLHEIRGSGVGGKKTRALLINAQPYEDGAEEAITIIAPIHQDMPVPEALHWCRQLETALDALLRRESIQ
jgi:hypothetical protein